MRAGRPARGLTACLAQVARFFPGPVHVLLEVVIQNAVICRAFRTRRYSIASALSGNLFILIGTPRVVFVIAQLPGARHGGAASARSTPSSAFGVVEYAVVVLAEDVALDLAVQTLLVEGVALAVVV